VTRRLLISALPGETRAAWLEDDCLVDLMIARADRPWLADNVYLGRVATVDRALAAAFVEIGLERPGFLPLDEGPKGLGEGDAVLVRVKRAPAGGKGARLSARLADPSGELEAAAARAVPPALIRAAPDPLAAALDGGAVPEEIVIDDPALFTRAKGVLAGRAAWAAGLRLDLDPEPLFERAGVEAAIDALIAPRVTLPSGGFLLIEPVRTLSAIDVNTGRQHGAGAPRGALAVNLEAAAEIPRQIRLRNLSGLVVVDFLPLGAARERKRVVAALSQGVLGDPCPVHVHPMRPSGLVELTRRRARPPLHEILTEPCGIGGAGRLKDPVTLAYEALRALRRAGGRAPGRRLTLCASPGIVAALEGPVRPAWVALQERLGRPLGLHAETGRTDFELVLE